MARQGIVTGVTALFAAAALGLAGCGPAQVAQETAKETAVEVAAAMGADGQALAALGLDAADLDVDPVAAPAPSASAGAQDKRGGKGQEWRKRHRARVLLRKNTLHGEVVVQTKDGGTKTVAVQRGQVTAIDGRQMTVKSADGFTMTWTFDDQLRVIERRHTVQSGDIKVGTTVGVAGAKDGDGGVARLIVVPFKQG
ncbi:MULTISPECIES: hypothetical protein [Micromonospora]|uniref:DUF5666 domain-containing protein n=1 Tax=Micromonospora solifontis TaxID=2487138 RepID=A0ABX9WBQ7_9ACTN|nr:MULTISPECIES: hypothetical protein [Micromonospora]NES17316.1 hypothetical protein [Micromonospora sp. PPF5-17B]NES39696.1 hypothetical protein [Micromonospora solifontis]NES59146.1 hypothetical protein [Micromonospora sp. PPF5-6]RNL87081.1 hypothetical protein EFE23_26865 [Micromonospora solifontis]